MEKPLINSLVLLLQVAFCQHIQLSNYYGNQNCTIINELDRILLHGKVDFTGNIQTPSTVNVDIKRQNNSNFFQHLCFLNVPADCGDNRINYCQCFKTSDQAVYKVVINITAYKANSEADVRAELLYRETSFYSEIRKLPKVYDTETESVQLYANDQAIDKFNSNVSTNDTRMTIFSKCADSLANQCTLQLINLVNNSTVKAGLNVLAHSIEVKVDVNLELRYFICNQEKSISFSIFIDTAITTRDYAENCHKECTKELIVSLAWITSLFVLLLSIVIAQRSLAWIRIKISKFRFLNRKTKTKTWTRNTQRLLGSENQLIEYRQSNVTRAADENQSFMFGKQTNRLKTTTYAQKMDNVGSRNKQNDQDQKVFRILICKAVLSVCYEDTNLRSLFETMLLLSCEIRIVGNTYGESNVRGVVDIVNRYCQSFGINTVQRNEHSYCTCNKCAYSSKPSDSFAEIFIKTAPVFLNGKANQGAASCVFYHGAKTTTISALTISEKNIETALLKCVTCDQNLINKFECSVYKLNELESKVQETFRAFENEGQIQFSVKFLSAPNTLRQLQADKRFEDLMEMLPLRNVSHGW
ncbi:hypothetical protein BgiMline_031788 [Biomphalaria glabrata]